MRHAVLAVGLLVVAGLRMAGGDEVWAAVLGAGAVVEAGIAAREIRARRASSSRRERPRQAADGDAAARPDQALVTRSLQGHRRTLRGWVLALCLSTVTAGAVLLSAPAIAAVLAVLALVCLHRVRRERRSVDTLRWLVERNGPSALEGTA